MSEKDVKEMVKERYAAVARGERGGRIAESKSCCCGNASAETIGASIGYSGEEMSGVPEGANLGLGCGNPTAIAGLKPGETVLDLGSGAGFDCFLAANQVGPEGRVIGIDMTTDMIDKARANAEQGGYKNVEFRLAEIEALPVEDATVDLVLSNCVINLSPDKPAVFREAFRVLKPGGRAAISDIVLLGPLPDPVLASAAAYASCVAGALHRDAYLAGLAEAGFAEIDVESETAFPESYFTSLADPLSAELSEGISAEDLRVAVERVRSLKVVARKPLPCCGS